MSSSSAVAASSIIYLGLDVHKDSITIAVLPEHAKAPTRLDRLPNDLPKLKRWFDRAAKDGELRACYEASGAGYVLHRALVECFETDHASHCDVCMNEAIIAARMTEQGKTPKEIQKAIDAYYAG